MKKLSEPKSSKAIIVLNDTIKRKRKEDYAKLLGSFWKKQNPATGTKS